MSIKIKLGLDERSNDGVVHFAEDVVTAMTGNANFTTPDPALTVISARADGLDALLRKRAELENELRELTPQIGAARDLLEEGLTDLGGYVETTANKNGTPENPPAAIAGSAGMEISNGNSPVGPMPKVTGFSATAGDEPGEVDYHCDPIRRGVRMSVLEQTSEPAPTGGWTSAGNSTRSRGSLTGRPSATRLWLRMAAQGTAGQGPWSDPVQVTVP